MRQYFRNLKLWACGIRWLWTRQDGYPIPGVRWDPGIKYKPGWSPWKFLPLYLTDYLAACLLGYGVVSLSRTWYDRSQLCKFMAVTTGPPYFFYGECSRLKHRVHHLDHDFQPVYPFAFFMTRLLNWAFPGKLHGMQTGPRLWGSVNLRD